MIVTAPLPSAATSINAMVLEEFKPEIEFRSGKRVTAMRKMTRKICAIEIEVLKKIGERSKTTAGAIAGEMELTDAVLFATIEKSMYATNPLESAAIRWR